MKNFINEFKAFISKGNVIDLAVGVIIGGAFSKIVSSLVNDIVTPVLGLALGKVNFTDLKFVIKPAEGDLLESAINYGTFIQNVIDFVIMAFIIFIFIKLLTKLKKTKEPEVEKPAEPTLTKDQELLTKIYEQLEKMNKTN